MRNPTKAEKKYWDRLANEVGCIICRIEILLINEYVSIHHIDGRTKKGCHMKVLPLCFPHHQGIMGIHTLGVRKWESLFGKQEDLLKQCNKILGIENE
jgi:hypothetical protein